MSDMAAFRRRRATLPAAVSRRRPRTPRAGRRHRSRRRYRPRCRSGRPGWRSGPRSSRVRRAPMPPMRRCRRSRRRWTTRWRRRGRGSTSGEASPGQRAREPAPRHTASSCALRLSGASPTAARTLFVRFAKSLAAAALMGVGAAAGESVTGAAVVGAATTATTTGRNTTVVVGANAMSLSAAMGAGPSSRAVDASGDASGGRGGDRRRDGARGIGYGLDDASGDRYVNTLGSPRCTGVVVAGVAAEQDRRGAAEKQPPCGSTSKHSVPSLVRNRCHRNLSAASGMTIASRKVFYSQWTLPHRHQVMHRGCKTYIDEGARAVVLAPRNPGLGTCA